MLYYCLVMKHLLSNLVKLDIFQHKYGLVISVPKVYFSRVHSG